MDLGLLFGLPVAVQVALGFGYLGYITAYAGIRDHHGTQDQIFITLAFGAIATAVFSILTAAATDFAGGPLGLRPGPSLAVGSLFGGSFALATCLRSAIWWRRFGRSRWQEALWKRRVHTDDGLHSAWAALIQTTRPMAQIDVHLKDGQVLRCTDMNKYTNAHLRGTLLGGDGSIVMVVEYEDDTQGARHEATDIVYPRAGTRLTYIPATEIARVDLRIE